MLLQAADNMHPANSLLISLTAMTSLISCRFTGTPGFSWCLNSRKRTTRDTAVSSACQYARDVGRQYRETQHSTGTVDEQQWQRQRR